MSIEHIELNRGTSAQLFKLPQYMIDYLWERIDVAKIRKICHKKKLAGYISQSYVLDDPQNLIIENLLNRDPTMLNFINDEISRDMRSSPNVGHKIDRKKMMPQLSDLWVNFQKKGEFQPLHNHSGLFSFVIWMDIPYHWKDEAKLPFARSSNADRPSGGNFAFMYPTCIDRGVMDYMIQMSPEMNGYCCFFPSDLCHQVYPFYTSDKERITISGNITFKENAVDAPFIVSNT
jgi:hypothetical protein